MGGMPFDLNMMGSMFGMSQDETELMMKDFEKMFGGMGGEQGFPGMGGMPGGFPGMGGMPGGFPGMGGMPGDFKDFSKPKKSNKKKK